MSEKLTFEILDTDDGNVAKRVRVNGGWLYLFQSIPGETSAEDKSPSLACCFVPDGGQRNVVRLDAETEYALRMRR
jgi:hypothetical protein